MHFKEGFLSNIRLLILLLGGFLLVLFNSPATHGDLFFWTDRHGTPHYSNVAPSASAEDVQVHEENNKKYNAYSSKEKKGLTFKVLKIYDGDSIKVAGADLILMVRLVGIDAPESGRKGVTGQPFSRRSKEALIRMVDDKRVRIKSYGIGGYNRLLAEVFSEDGINMNLEQVRQGMAEVYRGSPPDGFDRKPYHKAESAAKARRRGIWTLGVGYKSPRQWRKEHPRK